MFAITRPRQYETVNTGIPITADVTVFTLGAGEIGFIQNLNTTACYVKYGASASASDFQIVLKGGSASNDGNGASVYIDNWIGAVSIAGVSSTRVIAWKLKATT